MNVRTRLFPVLVLPYLSALFLAEPTIAQEWTRFRGPDGQGIGKADALPEKFTDANVLWRVPTGGKGHSSPVLWGQHLFLTRMAAADGEREVVCFDAKNGEELWQYVAEFETHRQHKFNSFASSTPAVDGSGIYVVWSSRGDLFALAVDHAGKKMWRRKLGAWRAQHGTGASPVIHGDLVIVANEHEGAESFLIALDKKTGKTKWKTPRRTTPRRAAYSCPAVVRPENGDPYLLFTSTSHGLSAVDPDQGKVLWEFHGNFRNRFVAGPCVAGDLVFITAGSGGGGKECAFVRLPKGKNGKPEKVFDVRRALPYVPCALAIAKRFFLVSDGGVATCVDAGSGEVKWRERLEGTFFSSPVSNGKVVYVVDRDGTIFSVAVADEFKLLGSYALGELAYATPAIAHGKLFVRTSGHLMCLGEVAPAKHREKTDPKKTDPKRNR